MPKTTKLGRVVIRDEEVALIKLYDLPIIGSFGVRWQSKYVVFPLALDQQSLNMARL